jgi:hypothetical protein
MRFFAALMRLSTIAADTSRPQVIFLQQLLDDGLLIGGVVEW